MPKYHFVVRDDDGNERLVKQVSATQFFVDGSDGQIRAINYGGDNPLGLDTFGVRTSGKTHTRSEVGQVERDAIDFRYFRAGEGFMPDGKPATSPAGSRILVFGGGSYVYGSPDDGTGPTNSTVANFEVRAEFDTPQQVGSRPGFLGFRATPIGKENAKPQLWVHAHENRNDYQTGLEIFYKVGGETQRTYVDIVEIDGRLVLALTDGGDPLPPPPPPPPTNVIFDTEFNAQGIWATNDTWSISNGALRHAPSPNGGSVASFDFDPEDGATYRATFDVDIDGGKVRALLLGGETVVTPWEEQSGQIVATLTAHQQSDKFVFHSTADGDFAITRAKLEKI